jgi:hypothetical protein
MEEDKNRNANELSPGIPRSVMNRDALQSMIVDRIQPAVGDLVNVRAIKIGGSEDDPHYAFCVEIRPGHTAYQSEDKSIIPAERESHFQWMIKISASVCCLATVLESICF